MSDDIGSLFGSWHQFRAPNAFNEEDAGLRMRAKYMEV